MNRIKKGNVVICGVFAGTMVSYEFPRDQYSPFAKKIKDGGRKQLALMLPHFDTKEEYAEALYGMMEEMHNEILAIASFVDDAVLQQAWGADFLDKKIKWFLNISTLLYMGRIKNDDMYGWLIMDHNSSVAMHEEGPTVMVGDNESTAEKLMKKAKALMEAHKKK